MDALEVALLDRGRRGRRAFRRISGAALAALLPEGASTETEEPEASATDTGAGDEVSGARAARTRVTSSPRPGSPSPCGASNGTVLLPSDVRTAPFTQRGAGPSPE